MPRYANLTAAVRGEFSHGKLAGATGRKAARALLRERLRASKLAKARRGAPLEAG